MLSLTEWDQAVFNGRHSINTLRYWARTGRIQPTPQLVGREYLVDPKAKYINLNKDRIQRLRQAKSMLTDDPLGDIDPKVLEILNDGAAA